MQEAPTSGVRNLIGIGTDIVSISEFKTILERTPEFLHRYFTIEEISASQNRHDPIPTLAGIFAAKESLLKAFGRGLFEVCELKEIEVSHLEGGKPFFKSIPPQLHTLQGFSEALLSVSHCTEFATATVALVKMKES